MQQAATGGGSGSSSSSSSGGWQSMMHQDDGVITHTSLEQRNVENRLLRIFQTQHIPPPPPPPPPLPLTNGNDNTSNPTFSVEFSRAQHIAFLSKAFDGLSQGYESLDASKPWLCYWVIHALDLLDAFPTSFKERICTYLAKCQDASGGFCGGPGQLPHLAPTYAAINALLICGAEDEEAYKVIDREKLYKFLLSMKSSDGGFTMHKDGEVDVRGTYCAMSIAKMLNILTPELMHGAAEYVARCQTYEGGLGGYPGNEAHGGYTFCGFAAVVLMDKVHVLNVPLLLNWVAHRQMGLEGGFQGRTNKLVDSCYSFWQGALFPLVQAYNNNFDNTNNNNNNNNSNILKRNWLFDEYGLQRYILVACQDTEGGGLKDKPGKGRDYYHTCYALSGLSVSQHNALSLTVHASCTGAEEQSLLLKTTHPVHNIRIERVAKAIDYFRQFALPS